MSSNILINRGLLFTGDPHEPRKLTYILVKDGIIQTISDQPIHVEGDVIEIDATGKWVTPSFIDTHTHYDGELLVSPGLKESARHGVTSVVVGSCSVSAVLNNPEDTSDMFTRVEALPRDQMLPLLEQHKTWSTPKEWTDFIKDLPLGVNVASFLGHSDLRSKVMGMERSLKPKETASPQEQEEMNRILEQALDAGFLGLSTMDNPWDKMDGDRYWSKKTPSYYSSWKERKLLLQTLRERGAILQGAPNLVTRINALVYLMVSTGLGRKPLKTTMITMLDLIADRWIMPVVAFGSWVFNRLFRANFRMQSPPAPFTVYYDGVDSVMFEEFPSGEAIRHLARDLDQRNALLKDPEFREQFKREYRKKFAPKVWHRDLSIAWILECPDESLVGKNFMQVANEKNIHPVDAFLDLILDYDKKIRWTTTLGNDRPEKYKSLYNSPYNLISFSDAGAHLNNMAFYNFPLKMMKYVMEAEQQGNPIMTMERCVWRLTKEQADWFGLDCSYIAEGKVADINILDPSQWDQITEDVSTAPIEEFGGYNRLVNRCEGVVTHVLVGGKIIYQEGDFVEGYGTQTTFGRFLPAQHEPT
ncbi:MAG: N-acyl-D-glutamate amidohydrolase [Deltaproteobacteria bacterium]|nr:MAG: N-acyl-D-glutamate amidohydrolase [Deltaproteobacteria bacterium]